MPPRQETKVMRRLLAETRRMPDIYADLHPLFHRMLQVEFTEHDAILCRFTSGGLNRVAAIDYKIGDDRKTSIVKVPRDFDIAREHARTELATLRLLEQTTPSCNFVLPQVERVNAIPFYYLLTPVPGQQIQTIDELSDKEKEFLGRDVARMAIWEEHLDVDSFRIVIDRVRGRKWNWHTFFQTLDFTDKEYPSLNAATMEMRSLRRRFYPTDRSHEQDSQVIQGDLPLPNLTFTSEHGERVLHGIFDWGSARTGSRAEECRSLYPLGPEAIQAANNEFVTNGRQPVDPEEIRFWYVGRYLVGLITYLKEGIQVRDAYIRAKNEIIKEFPQFDWSELPDVENYDTYPESGSPFQLDFNEIEAFRI